MQAVMVVVIEPASKGLLQVLRAGVASEAVKFFFVGLMAPFDFAIEARSAGRDEAVVGSKALAQGGEGVDFHGAI